MGGNIGDSCSYLRQALDMLTSMPGIFLAGLSSFYRTAPVGYEEQEWFINAVAAVETELNPYELLAACQGVEDELSRVRDIRWGPRTIDLDVLLYEDFISDESGLTVPHPRMHERAFVLAPLSELEPDISIGGKNISAWLKAIGDQPIEKIACTIWPEEGRRIAAITDSALFLKYLHKTEEAEKERIYCLHDLSHLVDVARVAWILVLENGLSIKRDVVYAAALLHDIGRFKEYEGDKKDHAIASAELAPEILAHCGYDAEEIDIIVKAIGNHRSGKVESQLCACLYRADKISRPCYNCPSSGTCKKFMRGKKYNLQY